MALSLPMDQVEHIGSTSVEGLMAKPVIDIQVGVQRYPPTASQLQALGLCGYAAHGEAGVPGRLYFTARGTVALNVHAVQFGGEHWTSNLLLRQYLRSSAAARERYALAKLAALDTGATRLVAYSSAKASVVEQLIAEAREAQSAGQPLARPALHQLGPRSDSG